MTPIFGKGVVFDASPERRKEMLHNSALRGEQMKGHAVTIEGEVKKMIANWGDEGEIELLDFFSELTIYTSTACLIGLKFREQLDHRFAEYYHELERGTDPLCYVDPYLPIESFKRRDEARVKLVALVQEIMNERWPTPQRTRPTATCSTCWCRSKTKRAIPGSPPTRSPECSSHSCSPGTTPAPAPRPGR